MRLLSRLRFRPSRGRAGVKGRVCRWVWMVVRFVCVIRVPARVRPCVPCVSRVCSGSPGVFYFLPAVESAAVSAVAWSCGCQGAGVSLGLD